LTASRSQKQRGGRVTGFDRTGSMLDLAKQHCRSTLDYMKMNVRATITQISYPSKLYGIANIQPEARSGRGSRVPKYGFFAVFSFCMNLYLQDCLSTCRSGKEV
jgi:hypothetical protein